MDMPFVGLMVLVVGGGDFGAQQVYPAAITEGVDGFAVHERLDGLAPADGVLLGVVEKDGGIGVNGNHAGICERVACHLAGFDGVALLVDRFGFAGGAVKAEEDGGVGHGGGEAIRLLVLPGLPEFPFGGKEIGSQFVSRGAHKLWTRASAAQVVPFGNEAGQQKRDGDEREKGFH
jgi:hypothetical protein